MLVIIAKGDDTYKMSRESVLSFIDKDKYKHYEDDDDDDND